MSVSLQQELDTLRLKLLTNKVGSGKTPKGGREVYSNEGVVFLRSQNVYDDGLRLDDVVFIDDEIDEEMQQTRVRAGDVLLNITGASIGRTCIVPTPFPRANVNQHVCIIRLRKIADPSFVSYSLKSLFIKDQIRSMENGSSREGLNFEQVGNLHLHLPPLPEQRAIAAFLDRKTAQIDAVVDKKRRLIERLQEKRQALISHAVTKGLDPHAPMKDSGIEWLGEIPAHWNAERLKFSISKIEQGWSPQCDSRPAEDGEWGVLKVGCVNRPEFDSNEQKALPEELAPIAQYEIGEGDILMSRGNTRELVDSAALVKAVRPKLLLCDLLYRFRSLSPKADSRFLVLQLRSPLVRYQIEREATGTSASMKKIGQETIRSFWIVLPPVEEQRRIIGHIAEQAEYIDKMTDRIRTQIAKLLEYRQTLISASVTGKIDVTKEAAC